MLFENCGFYNLLCIILYLKNKKIFNFYKILSIFDDKFLLAMVPNVKKSILGLEKVHHYEESGKRSKEIEKVIFFLINILLCVNYNIFILYF